MISIEWQTSGTMRLTLCIGRYALKLPRGVLGCVANYGERVEWKRIVFMLMDNLGYGGEV
jgi:hypothetical protein